MYNRCHSLIVWKLAGVVLILGCDMNRRQFRVGPMGIMHIAYVCNLVIADKRSVIHCSVCINARYLQKQFVTFWSSKLAVLNLWCADHKWTHFSTFFISKIRKLLDSSREHNYMVRSRIPNFSFKGKGTIIIACIANI